MCVKQNNKTNIIVLHSKLQSKQWPNIKNILEKIVTKLPMVNIQLKCYDREKESEKSFDKDAGEFQNKQSIDNFKITKFDKMKVNIYLLNIPTINQLSNSTIEGNKTLLNIYTILI